MLIGAFAVCTALVLGAAIARLIGLRAIDGAYLTVLTLALIGWWIGRKQAKERR